MSCVPKLIEIWQPARQHKNALMVAKKPHWPAPLVCGKATPTFIVPPLPASRFTASQAGFLLLSQSGDRPERKANPFACSRCLRGRAYRRGGKRSAAQHGGFRKGAGRPKGSRNRATIAREARQREALATARAENANLSAIDYLLQVLRDPTTPPGRRTEVAKFVAPSICGSCMVTMP